MLSVTERSGKAVPILTEQTLEYIHKIAADALPAGATFYALRLCVGYAPNGSIWSPRAPDGAPARVGPLRFTQHLVEIYFRHDGKMMRATLTSPTDCYDAVDMDYMRHNVRSAIARAEPGGMLEWRSS